MSLASRRTDDAGRVVALPVKLKLWCTARDRAEHERGPAVIRRQVSRTHHRVTLKPDLLRHACPFRFIHFRTAAFTAGELGSTNAIHPADSHASASRCA